MKSSVSLSGNITTGIIAVIVGILGSALFASYSAGDWQLAVVTAFLFISLVVLIINTFQINQLTYFATSIINFKNNYDSPKMVLVSEALLSCQLYGLITNKRIESEYRDFLMRGEYLRHQNIYSLVESGGFSTKKLYQFVNDHPFPPFTEAMLRHVTPGTKYVGVNALPDDFYSKEDIQRRINYLENIDIDYYVLPDEDIHIGLIIFDSRVAIICPMPANRTVGSFSEFLMFTDPRDIKYVERIFNA